MRMLGYVRVSTELQADEGYSLSAQREDIRRYCQLYNLELMDIISDEGESASTLERPGLVRALNMLKVDMVEGLIVSKLDRLTRSVSDLGYLLKNYFTDYTLMSVSDKIDTSSASGRLVLNIVVSVSQWEREAISERTKKVLQHKKGNGERIGNIPFGKKMSADGLHIEDNSEEQLILDVIKDMRKGGMSLMAIRQQLINSGNLSRNNNPFTLSHISKLARM